MFGVLQSFLAVVFTGAAVSKLADHGRFLRTLVSLPWLSVPRARLAARAVPIYELALVVLLLATPRLGAVAAILTLAFFVFVVLFELLSGRDFDCGCFGGVASRPAGPTTVVRNLALASVAVALLVLPESAELPGVLIGVAAGLAFLAVEIGVDTLALERAA